MDLENLLLSAEQHTASDILLSPGSAPVLRISGHLRSLHGPPLSAGEIEEFVRELVGEPGWKAFGEEMEYDFGVTHLGHRLRGNAYQSERGVALALRLIPSNIPMPDQLGIPAVLLDLIREPQGLILFTGAAGQGKSTTQASLVEVLNRSESLHIITVEDPIEFAHTPMRCVIEQREVGRHTRSFAHALRRVLRQNPDVILIGEMRDAATIEAALNIAETGHLVLSTLHSNDACQAVDRIVYSMPKGVEEQIRAQLSLVLLAVVNQRLVRSKMDKLVLAAEVLVNNPAITKLIREGKTAQLYGAMELDTHRGVQTMNGALEDLVTRGIVHAAEAKRFMSRRESRIKT